MNKLALVTGAGKNLGAQLALFLAQKGFDVAVHYCSSQNGAQDVKKKIEALNRRAEIFQSDLRDPAQAKNLVQSAIKWHGSPSLDVLINNAGNYHPLEFDEITPEAWADDLNSNLTSTFFVTQTALPFLNKSEHARVVFIGDSACEKLNARERGLPYHFAKKGNLILLKTLATENTTAHLTFNMISPGVLEGSPTGANADQIPSGRRGTYEDICHALDFVLSPQASQVTGNNIIVSGGWNF